LHQIVSVILSLENRNVPLWPSVTEEVAASILADAVAVAVLPSKEVLLVTVDIPAAAFIRVKYCEENLLHVELSDACHSCAGIRSVSFTSILTQTPING